MFLNDEKNDWGRKERPRLGDVSYIKPRQEWLARVDRVTNLFVSNYKMKITMKRLRKIERRKLRKMQRDQ